MPIDPQVRRANLRLLIAIAVFALALGITTFVWMLMRQQ